MMLSRSPVPTLRPFISLLWAKDESGLGVAGPKRERVLPTGAMHIVFRLGHDPLRLFAHASDTRGQAIGSSVIGGVRSNAVIKCLAHSPAMVGAMLRPGVAELVSNTPGATLADQHTCIEDVWNRRMVSELSERLAESLTLSTRLAVFETFLIGHISRARGIDPLTSHALVQFDRGLTIGELVADVGVSHRHLARTFYNATGLTPKKYLLLRRFNRVIDHLKAVPDAALTDVAFEFGFADQSHMNRDFVTFAGLTPGHYRRIAPVDARHVPIEG